MHTIENQEVSNDQFPPPTESGGLLTRDDVLHMLHISATTLMRYRQKGYLRPIKTAQSELYEYWDVQRLVGCVRRWGKTKLRLLDKRVKSATLDDIPVD